jgi:hypothetical protein
MPRFGSNAFLEFDEKECGKGIMFRQQSNKKKQHIARIGIQQPISCLSNNVTIFENNSVSPPNTNVGPFFPFHPLHFLFSHSFRIALKV